MAFTGDYLRLCAIDPTERRRGNRRAIHHRDASLGIGVRRIAVRTHFRDFSSASPHTCSRTGCCAVFARVASTPRVSCAAASMRSRIGRMKRMRANDCVTTSDVRTKGLADWSDRRHGWSPMGVRVNHHTGSDFLTPDPPNPCGRSSESETLPSGLRRSCHAVIRRIRPIRPIRILPSVALPKP